MPFTQADLQSTFPKKGAEATLTSELVEGERVISKKRSVKSYRNQLLDSRLRTTRTRSEAKLLREAAVVVNVPSVHEIIPTKGILLMEQIPGVPLKFVIKKMPALAREAGKRIRALHDRGIIHGDLTTSNILFVNKKDAPLYAKRISAHGPLFFIDFGLGFFSKKLEDKATDLVVFKKTFNATHSSLKHGWAHVLKGYAPDKELLERMHEVEERGRYH